MFKSDDDAADPGAEQDPREGHPPSGEAYDPIVSPWAERPVRTRRASEWPEDGMFAVEEPEAEHPPRHGDYGAFDDWRADYGERDRGREDAYAPRGERAAAEAPAYSYYPNPYQPVPYDRATDLQRRLQEETVTIPRPERRWTVTVREIAETLVLAVLIFLAVRASLQNFRVEGASMQPSLENGEYLIVNKLAYMRLDSKYFDWLPFLSTSGGEHYVLGAPKRGDIIVFRSPTSINRDFIKRIIGLPGDTVSINDQTGAVSVNGQVVKEPYIGGTTHCGSQCTRTIPAAGTAEARAECGSNSCYFVMGDNRQNSSDSRQGWLVPEENIIGKALITYWHNGGPELDLAPNHSVTFASGP